jgi:translation initiation factor 3 subunit B
MDFCWSPNDHVISYWTPEKGNIPARVTLIKLPSREIIRTKNLFGVLNCKLFWQSKGDYLIVKVDRMKSKKQTTTSFELFRIREKDIPVDVVESNSNEEITSLFWEPNGRRFVVLADGAAQRTVASFYQVMDTSQKKTSDLADIKLVRSIEAKGINHVAWSPKGRFCVLAGLRGFQGALQFWDTEENVMMGSDEHYAMTELEWDPTGRYITSSVSSWHVQTDCGFMMWSLTGTQLTRQIIPGFKQFVWRSRPPTLLSEEAQKSIRKNLKEYSKEFDMEDEAESSRASREVVEKRLQQWKEWQAFLAEKTRQYQSEKEERVKLYGFDIDAYLQESSDWVELE